VTPADVSPLRAAGLSERAIEDALYIGALFDIIVRVADAMDAQVSSTDYAGRVARSLRRFGYFL
jgi:alkylhydroperoxidase family enzyme